MRGRRRWAMFVSDIATATLVKVKEYSTSTFQKVARRLPRLDFIQRNRRVFAICFAIWLAANLAGFFIYRYTVDRSNDELYQQGLSAVRDLATKSGSFVLEKDILALNLALKELEKIRDLEFAAILDHENTLLAQVGTEMTTRKFDPLAHHRPVEKINDITVTTETLAGKTEIIGFLQNITFSSIEVGKAYIVLSASHLQQALNRLRHLYLSGVLLITILLVVGLVGLDRRAKLRALKVQQELESMDRIGPYLLQSKVARGGMAELFLANYIRRDGFRRKVAVKRILPHLAENRNFIKMFTREARLAALLQHPNIVQIFDYGKIENAYFIAMEYIDGKNLGEILYTLSQGLPVDHSVFIISEICKGLDYSHTKQDDTTGDPLHIVHRDISPQNLLISYQGEVKVSDYGISKAKSEPSLTQAGVIKGKLSYLSPEQALGEPVDHRADIYALGLVFYEMLSGRKAYEFSSDIEAIRAIPKMEMEPLIDATPQIPERLKRILLRCLEKKKDSRYQSASALYGDLVAFKKELKITFDSSDLADFMTKTFKEDPNASSTE